LIRSWLVAALALSLAGCDDEPRARHHLRPPVAGSEPVAAPTVDNTPLSHDELEAKVDRERAERRDAYWRSQEELNKKLNICKGC
jgi:hypothetical protein